MQFGHRVKSVTLADYSADEVEAMRQGGNQVCVHMGPGVGGQQGRVRALRDVVRAFTGGGTAGKRGQRASGRGHQGPRVLGHRQGQADWVGGRQGARSEV